MLPVSGLLTLLFTLQGQDWPQWRGPGRDGAAPSFAAPSSWPKQLERIWSAPSGGGLSTPIAHGPAIYLFSRDRDQEVLQAIDRASGKILWRSAYAAAFRQNRYATEMGRGPNSTPVFHENRVFALGITGILSCVDASTGALVWRKDFSSRVRTDNLFTGTAMSPVIDSGLLIVQIGDDRQAAFLGLDPATGTARWTWEGDGAAYASPVGAEIGGVRQIISFTDRRGISISARDGKLLWSIEFKDQWNENIVTPVAFGNRVLFSGIRRGTVCIEVTYSAGKWSARTLWENADLSMYMSSPVADGDLLYGMTNKRKGQLFCLDVRTGKALWTTAGREGANVSLVGAGPFLFALNETGDLRIARRNPAKFEQVADYKVGESGTWAQPVVLGRNLLIRDSDSLVMYRIP